MSTEFVSHSFGYRRNRASALREGRSIKENAAQSASVQKSPPEEIKAKLEKRLKEERAARRAK